MHELETRDVKSIKFDCILFQHKQHYLKDQFEILSPSQRKLPKIFIEHDPPQEHPTNTKHVVQDTNTFVVHVTHFNRLMWDNGPATSTVIEHGVLLPESKIKYSGRTNRGIVVINNLHSRGRRLGIDLFQTVRKKIPLDLFGMNAKEVAGGIGEASYQELPSLVAEHRFFFHPVRYTSLGLAVCEAMMIGVPVVSYATTEIVRVIKNGSNGFMGTNTKEIIEYMKKLLANEKLARKIGREGKKTALEMFNIRRFIKDWNKVLSSTV